MTAKPDKMQAQVRLPWIPFFGSSINSAVQTLLGWLDAFSLQCIDVFTSNLRYALLKKGLPLTSVTGLDRESHLRSYFKRCGHYNEIRCLRLPTGYGARSYHTKCYAHSIS